MIIKTRLYNGVNLWIIKKSYIICVNNNNNITKCDNGVNNYMLLFIKIFDKNRGKQCLIYAYNECIMCSSGIFITNIL